MALGLPAGVNVEGVVQDGEQRPLPGVPVWAYLPRSRAVATLRRMMTPDNLERPVLAWGVSGVVNKYLVAFIPPWGMCTGRALGIAVGRLTEGRVVAVTGGGLHPFRPANGVLDCHNSGTTARLWPGSTWAHSSMAQARRPRSSSWSTMVARRASRCSTSPAA